MIFLLLETGPVLAAQNRSGPVRSGPVSGPVLSPVQRSEEHRVLKLEETYESFYFVSTKAISNEAVTCELFCDDDDDVNYFHY